MRSKSTVTMLGMMICAAAISGALPAAGQRMTPRFFADDPMPVDEDTRLDAAGAVRRDLGRYADFVLN